MHIPTVRATTVRDASSLANTCRMQWNHDHFDCDATGWNALSDTGNMDPAVVYRGRVYPFFFTFF